MLVLASVAAAGAAVVGLLVWWLLATRGGEAAPPVHEPAFEPTPGVRILRDSEEIASISQRAAEQEYQLASRAWTRGARYRNLGAELAEPGDDRRASGTGSTRA